MGKAILTTKKSYAKSANINRTLDVTDMRLILANYTELQTQASNHYDPVNDDKIDMVDASFVYRDW